MSRAAGVGAARRSEVFLSQTACWSAGGVPGSAPNSLRKPCIVAISRVWASRMPCAIALTFGSAPIASSISALRAACMWWGSIFWVNRRSVSLKAAADDDAEGAAP